MSFASVVFFIFLPVVFCLHWLVPSKRWQNGVLFAASYFFYSWWDWGFSFLMLGASLVDYLAGLKLDSEENPRRRKEVLILALSINISILGFFKYHKFFADSLVAALASVGVSVPEWGVSVVLPIGISFYTFQSMSYTVDIYFRRFRPVRNILDYFTFVCFFPQLVAGPIERATALLPQFYVPRRFSLESATEGCRFIIWGLTKKLLVADNLSLLVNDAFHMPGKASGARLFLGTVCFAFQIYCDFSAYSDMAVGTARLFGVRLMRNFAYPYFSQSITEFWRRWHISLSTWFRDYIYIPLGGNRVSSGKVYRNLMVVTLVSGLWHGAAWHFVAWGGLHGLYLVAERFFSTRNTSGSAAAKESAPGGETFVPDLATVGRMVRTFALVCIAWIFFRAETMQESFLILGRIAASLLQPAFYQELWVLAQDSVAPLASLGAFVLFEWWNRKSWNTFNVSAKPLVFRWAAYTALCWYVLLFGTEKTAEFIYFQF